MKFSSAKKRERVIDLVFHLKSERVHDSHAPEDHPGYGQENANHYKWQLRDYYQHPQNHHRDSGLDEPARRLLAPLNGELAAFKAELVRGVLVQHQ